MKKIWLVLLFGCAIDHPFKGTYNGYVIEKGEKYSSNLTFVPIDSKNLRFEAMFLSDVYHIPSDSAIHKLYGMSDYGSYHGENSIRFGWRMNGDCVDVFAYWRRDGKLGYQWMGSVKLEERAKYELIISDQYVFKFNGNIFRTKRGKTAEIGPRYRLFPYYEDGKGRGAPKRMTFYIYEY